LLECLFGIRVLPVLVVNLNGKINVEAKLEASERARGTTKNTHSSSCSAHGLPRMELTNLSRNTRHLNAKLKSPFYYLCRKNSPECTFPKLILNSRLPIVRLAPMCTHILRHSYSDTNHSPTSLRCAYTLHVTNTQLHQFENVIRVSVIFWIEGTYAIELQVVQARWGKE
jgi:hypothetical protein